MCVPVYAFYAQYAGHVFWKVVAAGMVMGRSGDVKPVVAR